MHLKPCIDDLELKLSTKPNLAPPANLVMAAFALPPSRVRVIVVGQDPYPGKGLAVGRAFAVDRDAQIPASLRNILRELREDLDTEPQPGAEPAPDLSSWQEQGVLLLNRHLTTVAGESAAHFDAGWQAVTLEVVRHAISAGTEPLVLVLWGNQAQKLEKELGLGSTLEVDSRRQVLVLKSAHPSPLSASRGFFGSRPFSKINNWFLSVGAQPIDWNS